MRPVKSGHEFVEVTVANDAATASGAVSALIPLGKSYRSVKPVSVAVWSNSNPASYSDAVASVAVVDTASVKVLYKSSAAATVTATLQCEV